MEDPPAARAAASSSSRRARDHADCLLGETRSLIAKAQSTTAPRAAIISIVDGGDDWRTRERRQKDAERFATWLARRRQMAFTGRAWCDFVSYDPRLSVAVRLIILRVARDEAWIATLREDIVAFSGELDARQATLPSQYA